MMHVLLIAQDILDYSVEYANAVAASARVTLIAPAGRFRAQAAFVDPVIDLQLVEWPRHRSFGNLRFLPASSDWPSARSRMSFIFSARVSSG